MQTKRKEWGKPSEFHRSLTADRLEFIASLLRYVQDQAAADFSPEKGDTPWNHGCTAFERCRTIIKRLEEQIPWLSILDQSRHFVFLIDGYPVRFSKGYGEDKPSPNVLLRDEEELIRARQSFLHGFEKLADFMCRFIVYRDSSNHMVQCVDFAIVDESGQTVKTWTIKSDISLKNLLLTKAGNAVKAEVGDPEFGIEKDKGKQKEDIG